METVGFYKAGEQTAGQDKDEEPDSFLSLKWSFFTSGEAKLGLSDISLMRLIIYGFLQAAIKRSSTEMEFIPQLVFKENSAVSAGSVPTPAGSPWALNPPGPAGTRLARSSSTE